MKPSWIASVALVLSVLALVLASVALHRVGGSETIPPVDQGLRPEERAAVEPGGSPVVMRNANRPAKSTSDRPSEDATSANEEDFLVGRDAGEAINYGEQLDPDDLAIRYDESSEVVNIGPPLDPDAP